MITLNDLKYYLKLDSAPNTSLDQFLQGFIGKATSEFGAKCNRDFLVNQFEEYFSCIKSNMFFLNNYPVGSIESIQYHNGTEWVDVLADTISDANVLIKDNCVMILSGESLNHKRLRVQYTGGYKFKAGSGTIKILTGSTTVTGTGTNFDDDITAGDLICFDGLKIEVTEVTSATLLQLSEAVAEDHSASGYYISNVPDDIADAITEMAAYKYAKSPRGANLLVKSSEGSSSGGSSNASYVIPDWTEVINRYRNINI